jgi:hypothetical protein
MDGLICAVCGGTTFIDRAVIWDALAEGWRLTPEERTMVDRQQGTCCTKCGGNLQSVALAAAIQRLGFSDACMVFNGSARLGVTSSDIPSVLVIEATR